MPGHRGGFSRSRQIGNQIRENLKEKTTASPPQGTTCGVAMASKTKMMMSFVRSRGIDWSNRSAWFSTSLVRHVTKISDLSPAEVSVLHIRTASHWLCKQFMSGGYGATSCGRREGSAGAAYAYCSKRPCVAMRARFGVQVAFCSELQAKTLLMLFQKPSLRTRVSFEVSAPLSAGRHSVRIDAAVQVGMTQLGGHAIFYSVADSPLGEKESLSDTAKARARPAYCAQRDLFCVAWGGTAHGSDHPGNPCAWAPVARRFFRAIARSSWLGSTNAPT
jgi:hypothetical protein